MRHPTRAFLATTTIAVLILPLTACDRWSSKCDTKSNCSIMIQGDQFHKFPRPYNSDHGLRSADRIRLVSASEGGEAHFQAGGVEPTCTEGNSFAIADTTITCDAVGNDRVELTTVRQDR
ncbi:hypothetical protein ACX5K5_11070 [Glutamicibacter bergerei]|uniref:hypothetical protein n=1 Tax=Glutamicibacter TaxID=1742989 RepID=UPI001141C3FE|nr:hypothetical protein [Glutamicibacter sp. BW77]